MPGKRMSSRRGVAVGWALGLAWGLASVGGGCELDEPEPPALGEPGGPWQPTAGDGPDDGPDDEPDDEADAGPPACDLNQLDTLELEWLVDVASPTAGATPSVSALAITEDAIYAAGRYDVGSSEPPGYVERRTRSGQLEWQVELDRARGPFTLHWDGHHVYAASGHRVSRWTADGEPDAWGYEAEFIADIALGDEAIAVVGTTTEPWGHPELADAYFGALSKGSPPHYAGSSHAIAERDDHGEAVVASPWGGWIAAGYVAHPPHTWVRGYTSPPSPPGEGFAASFDVGGRTAVAAMLAVDDLLWLLIRDAAGHGPWAVAFAESGAERARERLRPCGDASPSLARAIVHEGRIWALAEIWTTSGDYAPLLIGLDAQTGIITRVAALAPEQRPITLNSLAAAGPDVYVGGFDRRPDRRVRRIGRGRWP